MNSAEGSGIAATTSRAALDQPARDRLRRLAEHLRPLLEQEAATQLDSRFGVSETEIVPADKMATLRERTADAAARMRIDALLQHYRRTHRIEAEEAVRRLVREVAFTEFNRLTAVRMLEAAGLLRPALQGGEQNDGFLFFRKAFPGLCRAQGDGGYGHFLDFVYDEAHAVVQSGLFDRGGVHSLVRPRAPVLRACIEGLTAPELDAVWSAEETMGWLYQYFTPEEKRREARDTRAGGSQAPRDAYELAFRNQFYTPDYVVRWLTDNTLGAVWRDGHPGSRIAEACPLLLPPTGGDAAAPRPRAAKDKAQDLRVLDPACGSGHFLLYAFDVLLAIYAEQGVPPPEAVTAILRGNLFGVDIDWRACQIAGFALSLRARKLQPDGALPRPRIVWAQPLPAEAEERNAVLGGLSETEQRIAKRLWSAFEQAAEAGSLLRADEDLNAALKVVEQDWRRVAGPSAARLPLPEMAQAVAFGDIRDVRDWDRMPSRLRRALDAFWRGGEARGNGAGAEMRDLFALDLSSGLDLLEVLSGSYQVVLMNPPFGDATTGSRPYIAEHYPKTKGDLYTAFVERGLQWLAPGGALGALGPRTAYFLKTSTAFREDIVLARQVAAFADLGIGVLDTAKVEAAAVVLRAQAPDRPGVFFRSLKTRDKIAHLTESTRALRATERPPLVFSVNPGSFRDIPGSPFAYWVGDSLRRKFVEFPALEGHAAEVRQGLATADDGRFLRLWWEVPAQELGRGRRWVPFAKGGEYSPYWDDLHLVVDWGSDGAAIRAFPNAYIRNEGYYFRPGLTFPVRASQLSARALPRDSVFGHRGPSMFCTDEWNLLGTAALMNTRICIMLTQMLVAAGDQDPGSVYSSYEVGVVQRVPAPLAAGALPDDAALAIRLRRSLDLSSETTHSFVTPLVLLHVGATFDERCLRAVAAAEDGAVASAQVQARIDAIAADLYTLSPDDRRILDDEVEANPATFPTSPPSDWSDDRFAATYLTKERVAVAASTEVDTATATRRAWLAGKRQKHRDIGDLALLFGVHPSVIVEARRRLGLVRPEDLAAAAHSLLSYCVGCAFGRWDIRVGQRAAITDWDLGDPFAPLPRCSPGMLQNSAGLPLHPADLPGDYPLRPPLDGLLVDDAADPADLYRAVRRVLAVLFEASAPAFEEQMRVALGTADLQTYLRKDFFPAHVKEYSGSQRQAPIYWQLQSPARKYGVWIYYPRLHRDTLATALGKFVEPKVTGETETLASLRRRAAEAGAARAVKLDAAAQEALLADVTAFRDALRAAARGFEVDFADGAVLNAAPLAGLLRWKAASEAAAALRKGEPAWSAAARRTSKPLAR